MTQIVRQVIQEARARYPHLAETFDLHLAILEVRSAVTVPQPPVPLKQEVQERLALGKPILPMVDLRLDWDMLIRLAGEICRLAARYRPADAEAFTRIAARFADDPVFAREAVKRYLGETATLKDPLLFPDLSPSLLRFVLSNALHPVLNACAWAWQSLVDNAGWLRGYCPICGGEPDFAMLAKGSGALHLLCSRCDFQWTFRRAVCPYCNEAAPGKIGYFLSDNGVYRLYICDTCKRYLKVIDLRELERGVDLPAERVATIWLDLAAIDAGYLPA